MNDNVGSWLLQPNDIDFSGEFNITMGCEKIVAKNGIKSLD
jgi:hypothetical protein